MMKRSLNCLLALLALCVASTAVSAERVVVMSDANSSQSERSATLTTLAARETLPEPAARNTRYGMGFEFRMQQGQQQERPETLERPESLQHNVRENLPSRPERPDRPEKLERPDRVERPELIERPEKPERPNLPQRPER